MWDACDVCRRLNSCSVIESDTVGAVYSFPLYSIRSLFWYCVLYSNAIRGRVSSQLTFTFHVGGVGMFHNPRIKSDVCSDGKTISFFIVSPIYILIQNPALTMTFFP